MEITPAWNTWDSVYPAQMTYLPLGLTVTPCAYAASTTSFTTLPATAPLEWPSRIPSRSPESLEVAIFLL